MRTPTTAKGESSAMTNSFPACTSSATRPPLI
eukprot:CAMPEP_0184668386 /NCGR_PEP_ID=MMETSP0308-20130426/72181_1 /TAXON_ID=38269 /ORGANISM="Gloeochaete witrockiana, Strain SAG 46.84" /LENGTH=31 /DNA_ID= /DNA_START= /DNA_END= /DNA_ORIENTATION=